MWNEMVASTDLRCSCKRSVDHHSLFGGAQSRNNTPMRLVSTTTATTPARPSPWCERSYDWTLIKKSPISQSLILSATQEDLPNGRHCPHSAA